MDGVSNIYLSALISRFHFYLLISYVFLDFLLFIISVSTWYPCFECVPALSHRSLFTLFLTYSFCIVISLFSFHVVWCPWLALHLYLTAPNLNDSLGEFSFTRWFSAFVHQRPIIGNSS